MLTAERKQRIPELAFKLILDGFTNFNKIFGSFCPGKSSHSQNIY
jgi:hypothetical protein